ncbi:MAG: SDR family NAD(P)-dependent oxidoreductase [Stackebrandtia sp.]
MAFDLSGRRALVTGAGHGIGAAIAVALGRAGADVVVGYGRSSVAAAETVHLIAEHGRKAMAIGADLTDSRQADKLIDDAVGFLGGLDILVCNAGHLVGRAPIAEMPDAHFTQVVDVNLASTFRTVRAAMPHLIAAGEQGRVIAMSSMAAHNGGGAGAAAYAAAKAGVLGLAKGLAKELAPHGVTVNSLAPGFIADTAFHDTFTPPETQRAIAAGVPLGRGGTADEVAAAAVFLASPEASYITGSTLDVDGGAWFR